MTITTLVTVTCLFLGQAAAAPPQQEVWLKAFEGTWVPDGSKPGSEDVFLTITREKDILVLNSMVGSRVIQTRYDLSGTALTNTGLGRPALFRSRLDAQKIVTEIWAGPEAIGPPSRIETRYLETPDRMVTELRETPDGPVVNRGVGRRK